MGKKKFLDKKKSATFQLYARDSADPNYNPEGPSGDRVFVRVDNNYSYTVPGFGEVEEDVDSATNYSGGFVEDPDSIFADAPEDDDDNEDKMPAFNPIRASTSARSSLPDTIRREILELGFPDDGYNYLLHMREIKNTGGGSAYYENSKAIPEPLSLDIKAYDASRVRVSRSRNDDDSNDNSIYSVAAKTVGVRVQKAVDPEVAALLDDDDLSRFGSDVEDLEEDFVVQANVPELEEGDDDVSVDNKLIIDLKLQKGISATADRYFSGDLRNYQLDGESEYVDEKQRVPRPVDEQFDQLCLEEYGTESDGDFIAEDEECLVEKLNNDVLINHVKDDLSLDGKYKVPADMLRENEGGSEKEEYAQLIKRTAELGNMHDNNDEVTVVIEEESSDDDEIWDCESIVSTHTNLENHPAKIQAPEGVRRKKKLLPDFASTVCSGDNVLIPLGKEKFPVDYLPFRKSRAAALDKIREEEETMTTPSHLQRRIGESKEEKKERKAAVKVERREARKAKKELKGIYRCEAQRAQKVAAYSGPSGIRLM